jgi:ABC-type sugar transport system ATPase subunit
MAAVSLRGVSSHPRGEGFAVREIDLDVPDGVVCALVGPSGSGKSTLLRLIAGLEPVAAGRVRFGDVDVTARPAGDRDIGWVPQEHPLYPHLDVEHNIGFALRLRRPRGEDLTERIRAEARAAGVEALLRRMPDTLSAGEQQAAAVARATAPLPAAYLLDEPLSGIDAQERARLRAELARLFHTIEAPVLLATNDQTEALALGDGLAVLYDGRLVQHGSPIEVHGRPDTVFVATFLGDPGMNVLSGTLEAGSTQTFVRVGDAGVPLQDVPQRLRRRLDGCPVLFGVRPEHLRLGGEDAPLAAQVTRVDLVGPHRTAHVRLAATDAAMAVRVTEAGRLATGERVRLAVNPDRAHLFDPVTERALWHAAE